jgi:hypothetical protein
MNSLWSKLSAVSQMLPGPHSQWHILLHRSTAFSCVLHHGSRKRYCGINSAEMGCMNVECSIHLTYRLFCPQGKCISNTLACTGPGPTYILRCLPAQPCSSVRV